METRALFRSSEEHPDPVTVLIEGTLPEWFQGTYYSVGNGLFDLPSGFTVNHSYDGYAVLYSIRVNNNNQAVVMSRFLNSDAYTTAIAKGRPVFEEFGTTGSDDPNKGFFKRMLSHLLPIAFTDNGFMNLIKLRGRVFAVTETCFIHQLNPDNLQSIQKVDLLKGFGYAYFTAHPVYDHDGSTYCIACSIGTSLKCHIIQFLPAPSSQKNLTLETLELSVKDMNVVASVTSSWKTSFGYIHSFAITHNYFIVYEQPFRVNNLKILTSHIQGRAMKENFEWHPEEKINFVLVERSTGETFNTKYLAPGLFITHVANAYEEDGHIIMDLIAHKTTEIIERLSVKNLRENNFRNNDPPRVYRFVFPLEKNFNNMISSGNLVKLKNTKATAEKMNNHIFCTPTIMGECVMDCPKINPSYTGKKYRYLYGSSYFEESLSKIYKLDLFTEEIKHLSYEETQCLNEPYFVPRPGATKEDDGLLIISMSESRINHPSAIIYADASSLQELGRVNIPYKIASIQHGLFIPTGEPTDKEQ
uniref:Beta,beta-carotene 9',10'-oxygenase n=1 Tax=Scolopendra viridis TaxID=118503 RepID=A0A4D5R8Z1_SCOVI